MVIPKGVNIPMPKPYGGIPPAISKTPLEGGDGELITVSFSGEIGPITQYLEFLDVLDNAKENDEVRIVIASPGGDVYTTQQLVERMESCKATVTTVASGLVASAATMIWLYGDRQEVKRWARFMFHSSLHGDWGKSLVIKENATELVKFMASILSDAEKRGVLLAKEVMSILNGKADVELSGATVKSRIKAEGEEAPTEGEGEETEGGDETQETTETEETGDPAAKAKKAKKTKKRKAEGEEEETPAEGEGEAEETEGAPEAFDFDAICEENGVEPPPAEGDEGGDEGGEGEESDPETTEEGETGDESGEPEAKAKKAKKAKGKKRKAEGEEETEQTTEEEETSEGGDDAGSETETSTKEGGEAAPEAFDFDAICEENGVEVPETEEDGETTDDDGETEETDEEDEETEEDDEDEGEEEGGANPEAKCGGKKKKAKKPAKRRRGEKTIEVTSPNEADKGSHAKVVKSRYW